MRDQFIKWLKQLLTLLQAKDARIGRVAELVAQAEKFIGSNGEKIDGYRKRSWVLNTLISEFPDARVKDLAFLIEQVIQEQTLGNV